MFFFLFKVRLQSWLSQLMRSKVSGRLSTGKKILFGLLFIYLIGVFVVMFGGMFMSLCSPLVDAGLGWFYFATAGILAFGLSFAASVFSTWSQLYESRDNDALLSMPLSPRVILASRMAVMLLTNFFLGLLVLVPAGVVYAMQQPVSVPGVIMFVLCALILPFFTMIFSSVLGFLVGQITSRVRNKNTVSAIFTLVFLGAYFYLYSNASRILRSIVENGRDIAEAVRRTLFPMYHLGQAISEGSLLSFVLFALCALVPFIVVYLLISATFINTVTARRGGRKTRHRQLETQVYPVRKALLRKEFRRYTANPMYMLNGGLGALICVIGAFVLAFKANALSAAVTEIPIIGQNLVWMAAAVLCAIATMDQMSAPSISLEGKSLWILKSLPVEAGDVLEAKARAHMAFCMPPMLLASLSCAIFLYDGPAAVVALFILPLLYTAATAYLGVLTNLHHPFFDWINETVAIKQSVSVLLSLLFSWAILAVMVVGFIFIPGVSQRPGLYAAVWIVILAVVVIWLRQRLHKKGAALFSNL